MAGTIHGLYRPRPGESIIESARAGAAAHAANNTSTLIVEFNGIEILVEGDDDAADIVDRYWRAFLKNQPKPPGE